MNKIRATWKDNGTPFFLTFKFGGYIAEFDHSDCSRLDAVEYDEGLSCMDALVDVAYIRRCCERLSDNYLRSCILTSCVEVIKMVKFLSNNK